MPYGFCQECHREYNLRASRVPRQLKHRFIQRKELGVRRIITDSRALHAKSASSEAMTHGYTRTPWLKPREYPRAVACPTGLA